MEDREIARGVGPRKALGNRRCCADSFGKLYPERTKELISELNAR